MCHTLLRRRWQHTCAMAVPGVGQRIGAALRQWPPGHGGPAASPRSSPGGVAGRSAWPRGSTPASPCRMLPPGSGGAAPAAGKHRRRPHPPRASPPSHRAWRSAVPVRRGAPPWCGPRAPRVSSPGRCSRQGGPPAAPAGGGGASRTGAASVARAPPGCPAAPPRRGTRRWARWPHARRQGWRRATRGGASLPRPRRAWGPGTATARSRAHRLRRPSRRTVPGGPTGSVGPRGWPLGLATTEGSRADAATPRPPGPATVGGATGRAPASRRLPRRRTGGGEARGAAAPAVASPGAHPTATRWSRREASPGVSPPLRPPVPRGIRASGAGVVPGPGRVRVGVSTRGPRSATGGAQPAPQPEGR